MSTQFFIIDNMSNSRSNYIGKRGPFCPDMIHECEGWDTREDAEMALAALEAIEKEKGNPNWNKWGQVIEYWPDTEEDSTEEAIGQHTPAPWTTSYDGHGGMTVQGSDGQQVGFVSQNQRQKLNARLIATAPGMADIIHKQRETIAQLVEVLEELEKAATESTANLVAFDGAERLDKAIDEARAAINRQAEGRAGK